MVTLSTSHSEYGMLAAVIGAAAVAIVSFMSFQWLGELLAKGKAFTVACPWRDDKPAAFS